MLDVDRGTTTQLAMPLGFVEPMLPTLMDAPPEGEDWLHELKYDGYRTQIVVDRGRSRAFTRNGFDWSDRYRCILDAIEKLPADRFILDGEMIVQDQQGRSDFHAMRSALANAPERLVFYAFDLLSIDGQDIRGESLEIRRKRAGDLIGIHDPDYCVQFSVHVTGGGADFFRAVDKFGLEGIVSKRAGSRYMTGRSRSWLKTKTFTESEFVVIGHDRPENGPPLVLLARETPDGLTYVGSAFVTLSREDRETFWRAMDDLACTSRAASARSKTANWVRPDFKVMAKHLRGEGKLRHATLSGVLAQ